MKRTPLARRSAPKPARKPMKQQSNKRRRYRASAEGKAGVSYMAKVAAMPCVICHEWGMPQNSPTEVHHVKSGRYGRNKVPDTMTIPLCHSHHNKLRPYPGDEDKVGFHNAQTTWEGLYGPDHEWINWVEERITA